MPNRNYANGAALERRVAHEYEDRGYDVTRVAGSHSPKDLVCCKAGYPTLYVQVKGDKGSAFANFGPAARLALIELAERAGAEPLLVWRTPQHNLRFLPPVMWP